MQVGRFIFLLLIVCYSEHICANEVHGCGGFIKSHADIDFSRVEIKLLTKQGSLKDKTDCSPSNGYYFLPIYDKGEYLLQLSPPPGWSFEPEQVELNFDGKNDICSKGIDVNFVFKGFGITGKVTLAGTENGGARNVKVELRSNDGSDVRHTTTDSNGIFSFTPVIPGKYVVSASHSTWHFSKTEYKVLVKSGNTELPENALVVSGFDVKGYLDYNGQLSTGVNIALFREKINKNSTLKCDNVKPINLSLNKPNYETTSVCNVLIDTNGVFILKGLPPGRYIVEPVVEKNNLNIHFSPGFLEFEVFTDTLELTKSFKILGFNVSGRVLNNIGGSPVSDAVIKLNGQEVTRTDKEGYYILQNVKVGSYTLQIEAPLLQFVHTPLKIDASTPTIETVVPNSYQVCGKVISKKSHNIDIVQINSTSHITTTSNSETGVWCTYLTKGAYTVEVLTTDIDKSNGIQFFPVQKNIVVDSQPINNITFSQLRATLNGQIKCLSDAPKSCTSAEITLHTLDASGQVTHLKQKVFASNGKFVFNELLPGPYEITIPQSNLCFDSTRTLINIASVVEEVPAFVQRGYEVSIISSHRTIMKYSFISNVKAPSDTLKLLSGVNTFCVPKFGSYNIKLEGCHLFDENIPRTFTTADTNPIIITAVAHKLGVRVLYEEMLSKNILFSVESETTDKQLVTSNAEPHKVDGKYAFRFDTYLKPNEVLHVTPKSDELLFVPPKQQIIGGNDCLDIAFTFIATRGLILRGKVLPPIKDVKISLTFPNNNKLSEISTLTSAIGEFKFEPIDEKLLYELSAEKESYVFAPYDHKTKTFHAQKLSEINVVVKDEMNNKLSGVLLSLSGGESYRKNLMTDDEGSINFHSLSPSKYYLRPMMKEYKFEPNSKIIDIKDGEIIKVELLGKRVAYSVFGIITNLNGDPFPKVNIEAIATDCAYQHQEEATSENNGQYRLRGLQPDCTYAIKVKKNSNSNSNVARSIPTSRIVKVGYEDQRGNNFIAISSVTFTDVKVRVTASLNEHYKTLRLVMHRKDSLDSPIYSQRIETPLNPKSNYNSGILVYLPRIPLDGKIYNIELKTSLSEKTYTYSLPVQQFVTNTSSIFVELDFKPEVRIAEGEIHQNSISALILVALLSIAFFKQDIAMNFFNYVLAKVATIAQDISQKQKNYNKKDIRKNEPINQREIEQMAEQINAMKKKKPKKI